MAKKTLKTSLPSQTLYKEKWKLLNSGGQLMEHVVDKAGPDLVRLAKAEEVVPGKQYYMQAVFKPTHFTPTVFDPAVSWETIMEFINAKKIYIKNERPVNNSASKPPSDRNQGPEQSSLF